ncbi:MAG: BRO family protein [Sarcina sp.]
MENDYVDLLTELAIKMKWKGKDVWVAKKVSEVLGYENPSKVVNYFLTASGLFENEDYIVLSKNDLREFKDRLLAMDINEFRQSPKLVLFYESGLVEFLRYRNKLTYEEVRLLLGDNAERDNLYEMKNSEVMVKNFKEYKIFTLRWNGRLCWIAIDMAGVLGYQEKSRAVAQCIISEEYEIGKDYDILNAKEVKELIRHTDSKHIPSGEHYSRITIFYKSGLLGFINYAHMPIGKELRKWLRDEVFEGLIDIEVGNTASENRFSIKKDNLSKDEESNLDKLDKKLDLDNLLSLVDRVLSETDERKLGYLDSIFKNL